MPGVIGVSAATSLPGVSVLWLGEMASLIRNFNHSVAVGRVSGHICSSSTNCMLCGLWAATKQTNKKKDDNFVSYYEKVVKFCTHWNRNGTVAHQVSFLCLVPLSFLVYCISSSYQGVTILIYSSCLCPSSSFFPLLLPLCLLTPLSSLPPLPFLLLIPLLSAFPFPSFPSVSLPALPSLSLSWNQKVSRLPNPSFPFSLPPLPPFPLLILLSQPPPPPPPTPPSHPVPFFLSTPPLCWK